MSPVFINDSAPLEASIYQEDGTTPITPASASWEIVKPDGKTLLVTAFPASPVVGERVIANATGGGLTIFHTYEWDGATWNDLGAPLANQALVANTTTYLVPTHGTYLLQMDRSARSF
jgi:hypothetical protein